MFISETLKTVAGFINRCDNSSYIETRLIKIRG